MVMKTNTPVYMQCVNQCINAFLLLLLFTGIIGLLYPLCITGLSQLLFPSQANGSLITFDQKIVGSALLGQSFKDPKYFWGRPSSTEPFPYNAEYSAGSNLGPTNPAWIDIVKARIKILQQDITNTRVPIPVDLITASGSGLDPHISPESALYQVTRVALKRNLPKATVMKLVEQYREGRQFKILGEPRINVLKLNMALDKLSGQSG